MPASYFLYARKSTDSEERQTVSIEGQIAEARIFAERLNLRIRKTFTESQTAKYPGRPVFNDMLSRIEKGEAQGILAWHPDRLARNAMDGGRLIHLLDTNALNDLKFPTFWFDNTPQGKFVLSIAFGQSKYYSDNLSENIRRGNRQSIRRREWPSCSPFGYFRNHQLRKQIVDPVQGPIIRRLFELYATGNYTVMDITEEARTLGLRTRKKGKPLSHGPIHRLLTNPFYYGHMLYKGEIFPGGHDPLVSKLLFDSVQNHLHKQNKQRRPHVHRKHLFAFLGLAACGFCGRSITCEIQKGHHYYRCTKKGRECHEPYLREESLRDQISEAISRIAISPEQLKVLLQRWARTNVELNQNIEEVREHFNNKMTEIDSMLDRLLDAYLSGGIEKDVMCAKKETLLSKRLGLQEKLERFERDEAAWLKPYEDCLDLTQRAQAVTNSGDLGQQKELIMRIGTGFKVSQRVLSFKYAEPWSLLSLQ